MSLRLVCLALTVAVALPRPAAAWNLLSKAEDCVGDQIKAGGKKLGQGLGEGAVEALQPALSATIATASTAATVLVSDVDRKLTVQVDHAGKVGSQLVSETRDLVGDSLNQVDRILEKRLLQVQHVGNGVVQKLDLAVDRNLQTADRILRERSEQLGVLVSSSLSQADQILERRIDQLDQAVGVRLGNVDVIATKQRLGLEQSLLRAGVLIGMLVFVLFVLRTLWKELGLVRIRLDTAMGWQRFKGYLKGLGGPLALRLGAAGLAILVLWVLYDRLPFGAQTQAADLMAMHRRELSQSLARFDFPRVRFHASQLEVLVPEDSGYYQAMAGKADLLRDLVMRPALLATTKGQNQVVERLAAMDRQLGKRVDPDVLTLKALVVWQTGDSKRDEHQAASLCGRALRLAPEGFALAPLAQHYIRMFLHAPYLAPGSPYGREAESLADLRRLAVAPIGDATGFPLSPMMELDALLADLDAKVAPAYVAMVSHHAAVAAGTMPTTSREQKSRVEEARTHRTTEASHILEAFQAFDQALLERWSLAGQSTVLAIFRLNDAIFTRAAWFVEQPKQNRGAPALAAIADQKLRMKLAPPRVAWEQRYQSVIAADLRAATALQEAQRFTTYEQACLTLENVAVEEASHPSPETRKLAAIALAKLGLYVGVGKTDPRQPAGRLFAGEAKDDPALLSALQARGLRFL